MKYFVKRYDLYFMGFSTTALGVEHRWSADRTNAIDFEKPHIAASVSKLVHGRVVKLVPRKGSSE